MAEVKSIQLPVDVVAALFDFAGRGRLDREEWRFLESWESKVKQGIAQASQPKQNADVKVDPPFDPHTEEAAKKRELRAERRKAEAAGKAVKEAMLEGIGSDSADVPDEGDADDLGGDETPRPEGTR